MNRECPESISPSPEFIKVIYDEKGRPIEVKPANDIHPGPVQEQKTPVRQTVPQSAEQEAVIKWIINLNHHVKTMREELKMLALFYQRKFNEFQSVISTLSESSTSKQSPELVEKITFIENGISNLRNQYNSIFESFQSVSNEIKNLTRKVETKGIPEKAIFDQLNSLDLRLSTVVKEISNTKLHEIETTGILKTLIEEVKTSKLANFETNQRLNSIVEGIEKSNGEIFVLKNEIGEKIDVISLNQEESFTKMGEIEEKINDFSKIDEELDSFKMQTVNSIERLSESQKQMKEELVFVQNNVTDRMNEGFLKIQKILNKPKKRVVIKPTKSKVVRFLKKNFKIKSFSKVLVVTDKRNSVFGKTLYEATRSLSQKSVLAVMEDRTNKMNLDRHVIEAIKQSNYVFIIGQYSLKKVKELSKNLRRKVKVMPIKRSLKYSIL